MQPLISLRILKIDQVGTAREDGKAHLYVPFAPRASDQLRLRVANDNGKH